MYLNKIYSFSLHSSLQKWEIAHSVEWCIMTQRKVITKQRALVNAHSWELFAHKSLKKVAFFTLHCISHPSFLLEFWRLFFRSVCKSFLSNNVVLNHKVVRLDFFFRFCEKGFKAQTAISILQFVYIIALILMQYRADNNGMVSTLEMSVRPATKSLPSYCKIVCQTRISNSTLLFPMREKGLWTTKSPNWNRLRKVLLGKMANPRTSSILFELKLFSTKIGFCCLLWHFERSAIAFFRIQ